MSDKKRTRSVDSALTVILATTAILMAAGPAAAQSASVTGFVQTGYNTTIAGSPFGSLPIVPPAGGPDATFQVVQARVYVRGQVDDRFGYAVQSNFAGGFTLLTAYASWQISDRVSLQAGQMLKPFGQDRTIPRHQLSSFDRTMTTAQSVNTLGYGNWDIGAMARIALGRGGDVSIGAFNGRATGTGITRDNDEAKNMVARVRLPIGAGGEDNGIALGLSLSSLRLGNAPDGEKDHLAWGLDGRIERGGMALTGEAISAEDYTGAQTIKTMGYAVTWEQQIAAMAGARTTQFALRLEQYDPDTDTNDDEMLMIVPNLNMSVSDAGRFQVGIVWENPAAGGLDSAMSAVVLMQVNFF